MPRVVCFRPRMAFSVPAGREAADVGTIVTNVRSPTCLIMDMPCVVRRCSVQPSRANSLMS